MLSLMSAGCATKPPAEREKRRAEAEAPTAKSAKHAKDAKAKKNLGELGGLGDAVGKPPAVTTREDISLNGEWQAATTRDASHGPPEGMWKPFKVPGLLRGDAKGGSDFTWFRRLRPPSPCERETRRRAS